MRRGKLQVMSMMSGKRWPPKSSRRQALARAYATGTTVLSRAHKVQGAPRMVLSARRAPWRQLSSLAPSAGAAGAGAGPVASRHMAPNLLSIYRATIVDINCLAPLVPRHAMTQCVAKVGGGSAPQEACEAARSTPTTRVSSGPSAKHAQRAASPDPLPRVGEGMATTECS